METNLDASVCTKYVYLPRANSVIWNFQQKKNKIGNQWMLKAYFLCGIESSIGSGVKYDAVERLHITK